MIPKRWKTNYTAIQNGSLDHFDTPFVLKIIEELGVAEQKSKIYERALDISTLTADDYHGYLTEAEIEIGREEE